MGIITITAKTEKAINVLEDHIKETRLRDKAVMRGLGTKQEFKDNVLTLTIDNVAIQSMIIMGQKRKVNLFFQQKMLDLRGDLKKLGLDSKDYDMVLQ